MTHAHCSVIGNLVLVVILGVRSKGPYSKDLKVPTLPPLFNKKQGDKNWKLPYRVLPTALSLYRMGVWKSPLCHRCGERDTIEHAVIKCPLVDTFWRQVQHLINKITNSTLPLTDDIKIIGRLPHRIDPLTILKTDLVNSTFTIARCAILKSGVFVFQLSLGTWL